MDQQQQPTYHYPGGAPPPYSAPGVPPTYVTGTPIMITQPPPIVMQPGMGPTLIVSPGVGAKPTVTVCPSCNSEIITRIEYKPSVRTHLLALLLCVIGCWPCVCVPYCVDTCNNIDHFCPNCSAYLGSYQH